MIRTLFIAIADKDLGRIRICLGVSIDPVPRDFLFEFLSIEFTACLSPPGRDNYL